MSGTRKILIVGNGFDLAHFLPTKYEHFIHAMKVVESSDKESLEFEKLFEAIKNGSFIKNTIKIYDTPNIKIANVSVLKEKLSNNGWFQCFKSYLHIGIETWIF